MFVEGSDRSDCGAPTHEGTDKLADKRRLFELFTALKAKSKAAQQHVQHVTAGYAETKSGGAGALGAVASIDANDLFTSRGTGQSTSVSNRRMGVDVSKGFGQVS